MNKDKDITQCSKTFAQIIEKEYINSMLDISCSDAFDKDDVNEAVVDEAVVNEIVVNEAAVDERVVNLDDVDNKSVYERAEIECRVFNIAGLNLALPLSSISETMKQQKILSVNKKIKEQGLYVGGINYNSRFTRIADLMFLIMDRENNVGNIKKYEGKQVNVLFISGCQTGITYDEEMQTQVISHEDVCWRDSSSDRTWLAGTVKRYGFSLLDVDGVIGLLNDEC